MKSLKKTAKEQLKTQDHKIITLLVISADTFLSIDFGSINVFA